jgi:hypothetical protein
MAEGNFGYGWQVPWDVNTPVNSVTFLVRQMMRRMNTMKLVKVQKVHGGGGAIAAAGTVDVLPLVNQIDGNKNSTPHGTVMGVPWWRLQGGNGSVICDPVVGDVGYVVVSDRDISAVKKNTGAQSNPGSFRAFDLADAVYVGGLFGQNPTQYLAFAQGKIDLVDSNGNHLALSSSGTDLTPASGHPFTVHGDEIVTGAFTVQGNAHVQGTSALDGNVTMGAAASVAGNMHVVGTSALDGSITAGSSIAAAGAISALFGVFGGFNAITRVIAGSISGSGTIPASSFVQLTASATGIVAGDAVMFSNMNMGNPVFATGTTIGGGIQFTIWNPQTTGPLAYNFSTNFLVIGWT